MITDGSYLETKEFLGGFARVTVTMVRRDAGSSL